MIYAGRSDNQKIAFFFVISLALSLVIYWLRPLGSLNPLAENIVYVLAPLWAVFASVYTALTYGLTEKKSLMFFSLFIGLFFLFAGEACYVFFDFFLKERPFPTIADALYLMSYPFVYLSIFLEVRFMRNLPKVSKSQPALFVFAFLLLAAIEGYFGIYTAYSASEPLLNNLISIGYGIGDLFIILGSMRLFYLARVTKRTEENYLWTGVLAGFGSITAADILFAKFNEVYLSGNFVAKSVMDSLWMLGYTTIAFFLMNYVIKLVARESVERQLERQNQLVEA